MVDAPERIWIEQDDCPYFYEESELTEVGSPVTEYVRADLYAALEAQLAEAKKALDGVIKACNHAEAQAIGLAIDLKTTEAALEAKIITLSARNEWLRKALEEIAAPAIFFLSRKDAIRMRDIARRTLEGGADHG